MYFLCKNKLIQMFFVVELNVSPQRTYTVHGTIHDILSIP